MIDDLIVEEIRKYRAEHAAKYGNDLDVICKALQEEQKNSKRPVVKREPRRLHSKTEEITARRNIQ